MRPPATPRLVARDYPQSTESCTLHYMPIIHGLGLMLFGDAYRTAKDCAVRWNFSIKNPCDNFCHFKLLSVWDENAKGYKKTGLRTAGIDPNEKSLYQKSLNPEQFMALKYCFFGSERLPAKDLKPYFLHCTLPNKYNSAHDCARLMKSVHDLMHQAALDARQKRRWADMPGWF